MLETEMKKLTAAIEALTAAMTPQFNLKDNEPVAEDQLYVRRMPVEAPVVEAPVEKPVMDKDVLTRMCLELSRAGHKDSIKAKLESYGVKRVTELLGGKSMESAINYDEFCDWVIVKSGGAQ